MSCNIDPRILEFMEIVESGQQAANRDVKALMALVRRCFETEPIYTDEEQFTKYLSLQKYFPYELIPWEKFLLGLWCCTYWKGPMQKPRWPDCFGLLGRGAGKDGFIAFVCACMVSPYNPVQRYDVDICANNEEQAQRPMLDFIDVLETPKFEEKLKRHYYHTKETVRGKKNRGRIKGHTNNPKGRDGLRSGMVIFNEVHQYENYDNITVFTTGMGKVDQPRVGFFTSNGEVSEGPLDDYLETAMRVLHEGHPDNGTLYFICRLDAVEEVHSEANWAKANPSLPYFHTLLDEIRKEYAKWMDKPDQNSSFITKRFGIRSGQKEIMVTTYEKIKATNKELPDLKGWKCVASIDYAELSDWASVNLHFRKGEQRFDINHTWICKHSKTLHRVRAPWHKWVEEGYCTLVDDVSIHPDLLAQYIREAMRKYQVKMLAMDQFRWTLLSESLKKIGYDARNKEKVKLVRPSDIMQVEPVIQECFDRELFHWGNNPCLRWAVNNTKRVRSSKKQGCDTGNFIYAKIEAKSRKTDPFMALVAGMVAESVLGTGEVPKLPPVGAVGF